MYILYIIYILCILYISMALQLLYYMLRATQPNYVAGERPSRARSRYRALADSLKATVAFSCAHFATKAAAQRSVNNPQGRRAQPHSGNKSALMWVSLRLSLRGCSSPQDVLTSTAPIYERRSRRIDTYTYL